MLVKLTSPDGSDEEIDLSQVQMIKRNDRGFMDPKAKSILYLQGSQAVAVRETIEEIDVIRAKSNVQ